jgi:hypothetical protein
MTATPLDVLTAARDVVAMTTSITTAYRETPEKPPDDDKLPLAIVRLDPERPGAIEFGNCEIWTHPIRIDLCVRRAGDRQTELSELLPYIVDVVATLRQHIGFNDMGTLDGIGSYQLGQLTLFDKTYWGGSLLISINSEEGVAHLIHD